MFILLTFPKVFFAQNDSLHNIDYLIENILEDATIENEDSQLYDIIEQYIENPIDLNSSDLTELLKLPFIDIETANQIIGYRKNNGEIFSYSELFSTQIPEKTIKILPAFTYLKKTENNVNSSLFQNIKTDFRSRFSQNIQTAEGYKNGFYDGSPSKIYNRMLINVNETYKFGFLTDKDAGEKSIADFTAYYFQVNNLIKGLKFVGGFYTIEFGQGLALWSPYSFAKSSDATNSVIKRARGISPYASSGEYLYLKGAAFQYSSKYFDFSSFYSVDKNCMDFNNSNYGFIFSLLPTDYLKISTLFFNENEVISQNAQFNNLRKQYISLDYELTFNNLFLTGEFATYNKSVASINTLQISLLRTILVVASIRNYPQNYQTTFGQGFGETKNTNNEFGIYLGLKWNTEIGIVNFYLDQFKFPNSTASIPLPNSGNELSFSYDYSPFPKTDIYFRYFSENKEILEVFENENIIQNRKTEKFRFELIYAINKTIQLKSRVELLYLNQFNSNEKGILLFEDVKLKLDKITIYGRFIFFQTDSFNSRIYEFENDISGIMTNPALYNSGIKWYLLAKYTPFKNFYISAKYSELYKPNETYIGTRNNQIIGNIDNKFSLQVDFSFYADSRIISQFKFMLNALVVRRGELPLIKFRVRSSRNN